MNRNHIKCVRINVYMYERVWEYHEEITRYMSHASKFNRNTSTYIHIDILYLDICKYTDY